MSKKGQPYILFCQERRRTVPSLASKSIPELVDLCSEAWRGLRPRDRQKYVRMAEERNRSRRSGFVPASDGDAAVKFDSRGGSLLAIQKKELRKEFYEKAMKKDIEARVRKAHETGSVTAMRVHILSLNHWMAERGGDVYPAEIGLVAVNIRDGIVSRFSQMVDLGRVPLGYRADVKALSEKYHEIWLDNEMLSDNYYQMVDRIRALITVDEPAGESFAGEDIALSRMSADEGVEVLNHVRSAEENSMLPIYVMPGERREAIKAMRWLCRKADVDYEFTLYELPFLFWEIMERSPVRLPAKQTLSIVEATLKMDVFLYHEGVSCDYHESISSCRCAGGNSTRMALIFCDYGCQMFGVLPVEGRHTPAGVSVDEVNLSTDLSRPSFRSELTDSNFVPDASPRKARQKRDHVLSAAVDRRDGEFSAKRLEDVDVDPVEVPSKLLKLLACPNASSDETRYRRFNELDETTEMDATFRPEER